MTALLPFALTSGLVWQWRQRQRHIGDTVALIAGLQCVLVLAAWGMLPFTLWR